MRFHERLYQLHIILGHPAAQPLWQPAGWHSILPALLAATKAARGPASLNLLQYEPNGQYFKDVKFGRLGLSASSEARWLHDYAAHPERQNWQFHLLGLWAPGRTTCGNQSLAPDLYLGIRNEAYYKQPAHLVFNPYVVVAGALDKGPSFRADVDHLAAVIARQTQAVFRHAKTISWGKPSGSGFTNAIGDLLAASVFKPGPQHTATPSMDNLAEYWQ
ncbi:hypothetical protein GCM10028821_33300 [Hymenobacter jeollabukensis]